MANVKNDFLDFYGEHNISPVEQDISELSVHYARRTKLYRQLGMPTIIFKDKDVCEVGPGGGYNSLAFFEFGVKHLDLVEANPKGIADMKSLFNEYQIESDKYSIYETTVERFNTDKKYDIVIAESFLQYLRNQQEVIDKLKSITKPNGIIVVTCSDDTCFYIEQIKRLLAHALTFNIFEYDKKVEKLVEVFEPQLKRLRGVSRSAKAWVQDQLLNPVAINGESLSLIDAIDKFGNNAVYLSSSPRIFTDYTWYKDIWTDDNSMYKEQYNTKGVSLILAGMEEEIILSVEDNRKVNEIISENKKQAIEYELNGNDASIINILKGNDILRKLLLNKSKRLDAVLTEISILLADLSNNLIENISLDNYPNLFEAFGRTQQYISFIINA